MHRLVTAINIIISIAGHLRLLRQTYGMRRADVIVMCEVCSNNTTVLYLPGTIEWIEVCAAEALGP